MASRRLAFALLLGLPLVPAFGQSTDAPLGQSPGTGTGVSPGFDPWEGIARSIGISRSDPDAGFTRPLSARLEVILVRPAKEGTGRVYQVDCSHTKPSQRASFVSIPWLSPVECMDETTLAETRRLTGSRGLRRPFATAMYGELRRAMAFGTTPTVEPGSRISLEETAKRVLSLTEPDRTWPAKSPRWLLREGAPGQAGAMQGVDGGLVAGFFDSWLFRMQDWKVEGSAMDQASATRWQTLQNSFADHFTGKSRGDWDLGREGFLKILHAAVDEGSVQAIETPRDPFEDAWLLTDSAKWGPAYKDFHRVPMHQVWPLDLRNVRPAVQ